MTTIQIIRKALKDRKPVYAYGKEGYGIKIRAIKGYQVITNNGKALDLNLYDIEVKSC